MLSSTLSLNGAQINIMDAVLSFMIDPINERKPDEAIKGLSAIISESVSEEEIKQFTSQDIWDCISQAREIMLHPCPENRNESYPYVGQESGFCMYKMDKTEIKNITSEGNIQLHNNRIIPKANIISNHVLDNHFIAKEKTGLLGLTAREDSKTPPVTRKDIVDYVKKIVEKSITEQKEKQAIAEKKEKEKEKLEREKKDVMEKVVALTQYCFFKSQGIDFYNMRSYEDLIGTTSKYPQLQGALIGYVLHCPTMLSKLFYNIHTAESLNDFLNAFPNQKEYLLETAFSNKEYLSAVYDNIYCSKDLMDLCKTAPSKKEIILEEVLNDRERISKIFYNIRADSQLNKLCDDFHERKAQILESYRLYLNSEKKNSM